MRGDHCRLKHVVLIRNIANRLEEKTGILDEGHQRTQREHGVPWRVLHYAVAAIPNYQCNASCADEINQRKEDRVVKNGIDVGFAIIRIDLAKLCNRLGFGVENLNGLGAGEMFLKKGVNASDARSYHVVPFARAYAKPGGGGP